MNPPIDKPSGPAADATSGPRSARPQGRCAASSDPRHDGVAGDNDVGDKVLDVLIVGSLVKHVRRKIDADKADVAAASRDSGRDDSLWREGALLARPTIGGFAARVARTAHSLWCRVHLCCAVPTPVPRVFERFFREVEADTQYMRSTAGQPPVRIELLCSDGRTVVHQPGPKQASAPHLPEDVLDRFDAILVDPGGEPIRSRVLSSLRPRDPAEPRRATVAICGRGDWNWRDFHTTRECADWLFFTRGGVIAAAHRVAPSADVAPGHCCPCALGSTPGACRLTAALGACLKEKVGSCRLVATLGACGACLLDTAPNIEYFPTAPIRNGDDPGAGDTLMTVTAVSSSSGAADAVSVRRGVVAATGCVAGLPLPLRLEELDIQ